jgi:hypothetical protein
LKGRGKLIYCVRFHSLGCSLQILRKLLGYFCVT